MIVFLLNGFIFLLIGLEFPVILKTMNPEDVWPYIGYAAIITLVALGIRLLRVYLHQIDLQQAFASGKRKVKQEALFDSKTSFIISWSGMRGIVSLAIALGLPETLDNGDPFPMRNQIIFFQLQLSCFRCSGRG